MFRTHILPAVVALWGVAIVINTLGGTTGSGAYGTGQQAAGVFGVVMVILGVRALLKTRTA